MKLAIPLIAVVSVASLGIAGYGLRQQMNNDVNGNPTPTPTVVASPATSPSPSVGVSATVMPFYEFSAVAAAPKGESGITSVTGSIKSNVTGQLKLKASFIDKAGKTVAVATGVLDVKAGESKAFELDTTDFIDTYERVDVVVAEQL